jgi:hypothetical protein
VFRLRSVFSRGMRDDGLLPLLLEMFCTSQSQLAGTCASLRTGPGPEVTHWSRPQLVQIDSRASRQWGGLRIARHQRCHPAVTPETSPQSVRQRAFSQSWVMCKSQFATNQESNRVPGFCSFKQLLTADPITEEPPLEHHTLRYWKDVSGAAR